MFSGGNSLRLLPGFSLCKPTNRKAQAEASSVSVKKKTSKLKLKWLCTDRQRPGQKLWICQAPLLLPVLRFAAWKPVRNLNHSIKIYPSSQLHPLLWDHAAWILRSDFATQLTGAVSGDYLGQEDCLLLNIYSPVEAFHSETDELAPVLVWIYGGGFLTGSARS